MQKALKGALKIAVGLEDSLRDKADYTHYKAPPALYIDNVLFFFLSRIYLPCGIFRSCSQDRRKLHGHCHARLDKSRLYRHYMYAIGIEPCP